MTSTGESTDNPASSANSLLLRSLDAWEAELQALPYTQSAPHLSHYQNLPEPVSQAYQLLTHGAELLHATATKYTLYTQALTKEKNGADDDATSALFDTEFQRSCESILVACLTLHDDSVGCARSTRAHARAACRSLLAVTKRLVLTAPTAVDAGIVWDACAVVLEHRLPQGNRNAMRRDVLVYRVECQETVDEFQAMIEASAEVAATVPEGQVDEGEMFDGDFRYSCVPERNIALACVYLLRCSRGVLNVALQAMEVGSMDEDANETDTKNVFDWISQLHDHARQVGEGVTEVGSLLYPPLEFPKLHTEVEQQVQAIQNTLSWVRGMTTNGDSTRTPTYHPNTLPAETMTLANTIGKAVKTRLQEFHAAVAELERGEEE